MTAACLPTYNISHRGGGALSFSFGAALSWALYIVFGKRLSALQCPAIALIIGATAGGAASAGRPSPDTAGV